MASNFIFLRRYWPDLAQLGEMAELYLFFDPKNCIFKLGTLGERIAAGIDLGVASLSDMTLPNGDPLAPFSGVQGIGVMKVAAEEKGDAIALALEALASPEVGVALAKAGGCAPANSLSYDDPDVAADEIIVAIEHTADTAQPMPNAAEMNVMWGPVDSMLAAVNKNGQDAASAAEEAQAAALQAIADMQ